MSTYVLKEGFMPDCSRLSTFALSTVLQWWAVTVETPLSSVKVDFRRIFLGTFPGTVVYTPEAYQGIGATWRTTFRIPKVAIAEDPLGAFLRLLQWTVTICDSADESHALYLHDLPHAMDPYTDNEDWQPTKMGKLVRKAKSYNPKTGDKAAAEELAKWMKDWVDKHPRYRAAEIIVPAPLGNPNKLFDLPLFLAKHLATASGSALISCRRVGQTVPQKDVSKTPEELSANVAGKFEVKEDLKGKTVLALDDIYSSGATMQELVRACRAAGAKWVLSLAATKTAKFSTGLTASDWLQVSKQAELIE